MAEESFKESFNWKKLTIDAVNTIIATAIGIIIGLFVDKAKENADKEENYQKIIVATYNNLENYQKQVENLLGELKAGHEFYENFDAEKMDSTVYEQFFSVFFESAFQQQDRWIEENFISNGGFIEDNDVRLKIGSVYSVVDLCKAKFAELKAGSDPHYSKYIERYLDDPAQAFESTVVTDKSFQAYYVNTYVIEGQLDAYLGIIKDLNQEIYKMTIDGHDDLKKELDAMRASSNKINEVMTKNQEAAE